MEKTWILDRCKTVLLSAIFFLNGAALSFAGDLNSFQGISIPATPFDRKISRTGVLTDNPMEDQNRAEQGSFESLFWRARSFRYCADHNGDYWQTPQETENNGSGDCEDKAVWLYANLKQNGYANVRLVIGKYRSFETRYHVWVTYTDQTGATYLLDPAIQKRVWKAGDFSQGFYKPVYSFDGQNRYRHPA